MVCSAISNRFKVLCGICQGQILSPFLFTCYTDELITDLQNNGFGCYIGSQLFGCVMYADDLFILSGSVDGLQKMLNICTVYGDLCHIIFNAKKTICLVVGKLRTFNRCNMHIDDNIVPWSDKLKYLGISLVCNDFNYCC